MAGHTVPSVIFYVPSSEKGEPKGGSRKRPLRLMQSYSMINGWYSHCTRVEMRNTVERKEDVGEGRLREKGYRFWWKLKINNWLHWMSLTGFFQCGPASVAAVRSGQIGLAYDVTFVLSEVNAGTYKINKEGARRGPKKKMTWWKYEPLPSPPPKSTRDNCLTLVNNRFGALARGQKIGNWIRPNRH